MLQSSLLRYWHIEELVGTVELALVSNQGYPNSTMIEQLLWQRLAENLGEEYQLQAFGAAHLVLSVRRCANHPDVFDMRRKPRSIMLWEVRIAHGVLPDRTLLVGKQSEGALADARANVSFVKSSRFFGWEMTP